MKDSSLVSYIGHTSGTSGARPKPIPLTNANLISSTEQTIIGGYGVQEEDKVIHELPFFSPLGACNNYLIDLASGANLIDVPEFEINEFGYAKLNLKIIDSNGGTLIDNVEQVYGSYYKISEDIKGIINAVL